MFQDGELGRLHFMPLEKKRRNTHVLWLLILFEFPIAAVHAYRFLETRHWRHVQTSDDGHQRVEIANVERLARHFNPIFNHLYSLLLLRVLQRQKKDKFEKKGEIKKKSFF